MLGEGEQQIWNRVVQAEYLEPEYTEDHPVRLRVKNILQDLEDLQEAIVINGEKRHITLDESTRAFEMLGCILKGNDTESARAFIAELPYEETNGFLELVLKLPPSSDLRAQS